MSNRNSPSPPRKKLPKHPPVSLQNSNNRLKKVISASSYVAEPDEGQEGLKADSSQRSKTSDISSKTRIIRKSNEVINEHETSNTTFNGKKHWTYVPKPQGHSTPDPHPSGNNKVEKESELVGMLSKQLYLAESQLQRMQAIMAKADDRLKSKDQEIGRLKRKVKDWEAKCKNQDLVHKKELQKQRVQAEDSEYLYRRCLMMEHKIYEMEKFLADYGLVWVGDTSNNTNPSEAMPNDYIKNYYTQLVANIEELNLAVGKGEVHVHHNQGGGGATFKTSSCMNLKFYKNGLVVQNGPLRPYEDPRAASFLRDILDGYFPSELQSAYPNGVPFKVEDHRTETFAGPGGGFPGHGYRLGKQPPGENGSAMAARSGTASVASSRCSVAQRQNFYSIDPTVPFTPSTSRSVKTKNLTENPSAEMMHLRSQILASHNNNCSDSHIQSHINAELGLSARREKVSMEQRRELATKSTEYHISVKERTLKLRDVRMGPPRLTSGSRTSHHSSTDRSSLGITSSRIDNLSTGSRSRSRSASLTGGRFKIRSLSKLRVPSATASASPSKTSNLAGCSAGTKKPRATKSATLERKSAPPILHQINEPTGKPGELRLKVRSLNGSTVYLVHVFADDTVARLYHLLDTSLGKVRLRGYKVVISGYAPKRLEQLGVSLREYGISRDSVLHLVND